MPRTCVAGTVDLLSQPITSDRSAGKTGFSAKGNSAVEPGSSRCLPKRSARLVVSIEDVAARVRAADEADDMARNASSGMSGSDGPTLSSSMRAGRRLGKSLVDYTMNLGRCELLSAWSCSGPAA